MRRWRPSPTPSHRSTFFLLDLSFQSSTRTGGPPSNPSLCICAYLYCFFFAKIRQCCRCDPSFGVECYTYTNGHPPSSCVQDCVGEELSCAVGLHYGPTPPIHIHTRDSLNCHVISDPISRNSNTPLLPPSAPLPPLGETNFKEPQTNKLDCTSQRSPRSLPKRKHHNNLTDRKRSRMT